MLTTAALKPGAAAALGGGSLIVTLDPLGLEEPNPHAERERSSTRTSRSMAAAWIGKSLENAKRSAARPGSGDAVRGERKNRI
jgi:hypothetical protein